MELHGFMSYASKFIYSANLQEQKSNEEGLVMAP